MSPKTPSQRMSRSSGYAPCIAFFLIWSAVMYDILLKNPRLFFLQMLLAGALATVAFDFFGQSLSPGLGFANLAPVPLANQVWQTLFGVRWTPAAQFLHYFAGLVAYPLGWMLIVEPLRRAVLPQFPVYGASVLYGIGLWIFALYFMAHLIAGNPAFLGFTGITWVALVGHIGFALVVTCALFRLAPLLDK